MSVDQLHSASIPSRPTASTLADDWFRWSMVWEIGLLWILFFTYAGEPPPMINEAHYLVKAKNFWQPDWCANDVFVASGQAHWLFFVIFGWPTKFLSLSATAWIGRSVGWAMIASGLWRLCDKILHRRYASLLVACIWIVGIEYGNLAGEWVIGGIESKVPAYGLVLLGLSFLAERRWNWVWPLFGCAAAFHVLVGGWSVIAALTTWVITERQHGQRLITPWLFLGGAISLLGLIPAVMLSWGTVPEQSAAAAWIYTYFRLTHHLLPAAFPIDWYVRHGILIVLFVLALFVSRRRITDSNKVFSWFVASTMLLLAIGLMLGIVPAYDSVLAAKWLRYYWFRLPDAMIPLGLGMLVTWILLDTEQDRLVRLSASLVFVGTGLGFATSCWEHLQSSLPPSVRGEAVGWDRVESPQAETRYFEDWKKVCQFIERSTPEDEVLLTPRHQQSFKWYAGRAEVVNWKDVPQDTLHLIEWRRRFSDVFPMRLGRRRTTIRYEDLLKLQQQYHVRYMIVDRRVVGLELPLARVYPRSNEMNQTYAVYLLPRASDVPKE